MHCRYAVLWSGLVLVAIGLGCGGDPSAPADSAAQSADAGPEDAAPQDAVALEIASESDAAGPADTGLASDLSSVQAASPPERLGGERPASYVVPDGIDPAVPTPVVLVLHGFGVNGLIQDAYLGISRRAEERGFIAIMPDGLQNTNHQGYWNATGACCDFEKSGVDDAAYLMGLVDELEMYYAVSDLYLIGHSNGGFMSYRLACDYSDRVTALVSMAGATFKDPALCQASSPVSVLEVHGTADTTIRFDGADQLAAGFAGYPSAFETAGFWANLAGCESDPSEGASVDVDLGLDGAETTEWAWTGCQAGFDVGLWQVEGGPHIPNLAPDFGARALDFLLAHHKP